MINYLRDLYRVLNSPCRDLSALFSRQLDEPLSRGERAGMRVHVLYCRGCSRFRAQVRRIRELAASIGDNLERSEGLPGAVRDRLLLRVRKEPTKN